MVHPKLDLTDRFFAAYGHASRRDIEDALGGVVKVSPVASVCHIRLTCQSNVDLTAAQPLLEVRHVEADRCVMAPGFLTNIDALPCRVPGVPEAEPGEVVEEVTVHPAAPSQAPR
jgi:hypothetical protein